MLIIDHVRETLASVWKAYLRSVLLVKLLCAGSGCVYSRTGIYASLVTDKNKCVSSVVVHASQMHTCIYPPDFSLLRDVFRVDGDAWIGIESLIRLPTKPLEIFYNACSMDDFVLTPKRVVCCDSDATDCVALNRDFVKKVTNVRLQDGREVGLPFICYTRNECDKGVCGGGEMILDLIDNEGWLWVRGSVLAERFCGVKYNYKAPYCEYVLYKISIETGEVVPIVRQGFFDRVLLDSEQKDFCVGGLKRRFADYDGVGRIFLQSSL